MFKILNEYLDHSSINDILIKLKKQNTSELINILNKLDYLDKGSLDTIKYNIEIFTSFGVNEDAEIIYKILMNKKSKAEYLGVNLNLMLDFNNIYNNNNLLAGINNIVYSIAKFRDEKGKYPVIKFNYFMNLSFENGLMSLLNGLIKYKNVMSKEGK